MTDMTWARHAACQGADPHQFFPEETGARNNTGTRPLARATAMRYCATCPVLLECRSHARKHERYGVWGGEAHWYDGHGPHHLNLLNYAEQAS